MLNIDINARFKEIRLMLKLNQKNLANILNTSQGAISKIENGTTSPNIQMIVRLCELSKISVEEFLKIDSLNNELSPDLIILIQKAKLLNPNQLSKIIELIDSIIGENH